MDNPILVIALTPSPDSSMEGQGSRTPADILNMSDRVVSLQCNNFNGC